MSRIEFINQNENFVMEQPDMYKNLFFPLASEMGIKSVVTPMLGGDSKLNQNAFIMEPVSIENLHNNRGSRNFWCLKDLDVAWSATGQSAANESLRLSENAEETELIAGFMWQKIKRKSSNVNLESEILSYVPHDENIEVMHVKITNISEKKCRIVPTASIPLYGRSADNLRDHRHVTSLLNRIYTTEFGILLSPTLSFDERGHHINKLTYFVCGITGNGKAPVSFFPTVDSFLGESGSFTAPEAIIRNHSGVLKDTQIEGVEAVGGLRFEETVLDPKQSVDFTIIIGVTENENDIQRLLTKFDNSESVYRSRVETEEYWKNQVNVWFHTGNENFDSFMRWVGFQPFLRRIYGCSFLPYHDYGKGGRGWRDLWQDCLALLMMNPSGVRSMILDNFAGVRLDGTNATIIGEKQGEFIADRNNITRVWMDHGVWPWKTTCLYMDQTGDIEILNEKVFYFKDKQVSRGTMVDEYFDSTEGSSQKDVFGNLVNGSVLEHLLLQNLTAFFEVGEHNHMRIRGADWNDALDMAEERGESVAFTCAYAGNLQELASYIRHLKQKTGQKTVKLLEEIKLLVEFKEENYGCILEKNNCLKEFTESCRHRVSGKYFDMDLEALANNLDSKAYWIINHIRETEWKQESDQCGWFNGYYDNHGSAVEGLFQDKVRMILTGQVFSVMGNVATNEQVTSIFNAAMKHLFVKDTGGFRINTDFKEEKYDLGRMFGFAYGTKENGAVFSHMTVMFSKALYQRGFVKEGYLALQTLAETSLDFETSKMFPGIPEYFDVNGRGMYQYLTGAASWYLLTMITEVFGVKGFMGDLFLEPKLMKEQFDSNGYVSIDLQFAEKKICVQYQNKEFLEYGEYQIQGVVFNHVKYPIKPGNSCMISRIHLMESTHEKQIIEIMLG